MPKRIYHVNLTPEEKLELLELIKNGKTQAYRITHAQVLLKLDQSASEITWTLNHIAEAYHITVPTVCSIAKRFVMEGMTAALDRKKQLNRRRKITGDVEAKIIAIACSGPPQGHSVWTLQLIANKLVELNVVDSISSTAVGTTLKKMNLSHGRVKNGVSQNQERNL